MVGNLEAFFSKCLHLSDEWQVTDVEMDDGETKVDLYVSRKKSPAPVCPECGCACRWHDTRNRAWRHADLFDMECIIHCDVPRYRCPGCGKTEMVDVPWANPGSGFTLLFEAKSIALMKEMPVLPTARFLNINDKPLWTILNNHVDRCMEKQDLSYLDAFYVDETSSAKGHTYISVFADREHRIVFVTDGNDADSVTAFREHLESRGGKAENIRFICCDMGKGFKAGIAREFPDAVVTYDRFHVMQHMSKSLDATRRAEWNMLREDGRLSEASDIKGQRFLLLRNNDNLDPNQQARIRGILNSHKDIGFVYAMKESLRDTWAFDNGYDAAHHLLSWLLTAEREGPKTMKDIVKLIDNSFDEILNWFKSGMTNGVMEGINSIIQAVKSRARGYRDWTNLRSMCYLRGSGLC